MSKATNRKLVRAAIVETAEALTALKPEWERRDDLKLIVEGVERAINEALKLLQNSAPTERRRSPSRWSAGPAARWRRSRPASCSVTTRPG